MMTRAVPFSEAWAISSPGAFHAALYDLQIASDAFKQRYRKMFKCPYCVSDYLRLVKGKFGEFWGCSGYGIKEDQCTYTSNIHYS